MTVPDTDIERSHLLHFQTCNCLGDSAECCRENCPCHNNQDSCEEPRPVTANLAGARWALDYLLFEDEKSKVLSVHGATCLDVLRRYIEAQERDGASDGVR